MKNFRTSDSNLYNLGPLYYQLTNLPTELNCITNGLRIIHHFVTHCPQGSIVGPLYLKWIFCLRNKPNNSYKKTARKRKIQTVKVFALLNPLHYCGKKVENFPELGFEPVKFGTPVLPTDQLTYWAKLYYKWSTNYSSLCHPLSARIDTWTIISQMDILSSE